MPSLVPFHILARSYVGCGAVCLLEEGGGKRVGVEHALDLSASIRLRNLQNVGFENDNDDLNPNA